MTHPISRRRFDCPYAALSAVACSAWLGACGSSTPASSSSSASAAPTTPSIAVRQSDSDRMNWWREARFGMFIHWGLYAIPAGQWGTQTDHGEWIMNTAHIPVEEYEKFLGQFNPVKFDARKWVKLAKAAGMKYVVITSKHHDGFGLFDSKVSDYDVMATPFKRDIMKEMAEACRAEGIRICWYHSIMDWHHPDYTPRRDWETRPTTGANFDRYVAYMKGELRELLTNYGPIGVLWFDGQWEGTWNNDRGRDLDAYVRGLQPNIIINSRVGRGGGAYGLEDTEHGGRLGDYGTPEQFIPDTNPGIDWETCMTMNEHWGYNRVDKNFKSTEDLVRKLADIASKGGNFLLNVGPTPEGEIPPESIDRLTQIAKWMDVNGDSIHGTQASPGLLMPWGRCTMRPLGAGKTRLYLHVFDWPKDGTLVVPGLLNGDGATASMLTGGDGTRLAVTQREESVVIALPARAPDAIDSVVTLDLAGSPDVSVPPVISSPHDMFIDSVEVSVASTQANVELRYTTDGQIPTAQSALLKGPVRVSQTSTVTARAFRGTRPVSVPAKATFTKVVPRRSVQILKSTPGLAYDYYEGEFDKLPDFGASTPAASGQTPTISIKVAKAEHKFALRFQGFLSVPADGVYTISVASDDGSRLWIGDQLLVDNDGLHSLEEKKGSIALGKGVHPLMIGFFERTGGHELHVTIEGPGMAKQDVPAAMLVH